MIGRSISVKSLFSVGNKISEAKKINLFGKVSNFVLVIFKILFNNNRNFNLPITVNCINRSEVRRHSWRHSKTNSLKQGGREGVGLEVGLDAALALGARAGTRKKMLAPGAGAWKP